MRARQVVVTEGNLFTPSLLHKELRRRNEVKQEWSIRKNLGENGDSRSLKHLRSVIA